MLLMEIQTINTFLSGWAPFLCIQEIVIFHGKMRPSPSPKKTRSQSPEKHCGNETMADFLSISKCLATRPQITYCGAFLTKVE